VLKAEFFTRFGMLVVDRFIDEATCARLRREVGKAACERAAVWRDGESVVDPTARRTTRAEISDAARSIVERRLMALKPRLERHFSLALRGIQKPQFLVYQPGDFFECHSDDNPTSAGPEYLRERRVSAVVFLNGGRRGRASAGGSLTFPGLVRDPRLAGCGFPVLGRTGLLIAFRSSLAHAVSPVCRGARYTVVAWFV
jgi:predicted 2-oxoglutarate/Fe(II)-dependent dioxygenase YbiX